MGTFLCIRLIAICGCHWCSYWLSFRPRRMDFITVVYPSTEVMVGLGSHLGDLGWVDSMEVMEAMDMEDITEDTVADPGIKDLWTPFPGMAIMISLLATVIMVPPLPMATMVPPRHMAATVLLATSAEHQPVGST